MIRKWFTRRPGVVYALNVAGVVWIAYVGKTFQRPWTKRVDDPVRGHRATQPWGRHIVRSRVLWSGNWTPFGLWWREILLIILLMPRMNYQWNRHAPWRITKWRQRERWGTPGVPARTYRSGHAARSSRTSGRWTA